MKTCCALHNMILCFDGLDLTSWEDDKLWETLEPDEEELQDTQLPVAQQNQSLVSLQQNQTNTELESINVLDVVSTTINRTKIDINLGKNV